MSISLPYLDWPGPLVITYSCPHRMLVVLVIVWNALIVVGISWWTNVCCCMRMTCISNYLFVKVKMSIVLSKIYMSDLS